MRETRFIEQNKAKWQDFEDSLKEKQSDPEKLNELFIEVTDDLSYARTFYPNRSVKVFLNGLAQKVYFSIYKNQRFRWQNVVEFWRDELPCMMYDARREMRLSAIVFLAAFLIGVVSTIMDPEFPRVILGNGYVDQTLRNIERGDPMAVYKDPNAGMMAIQITFNNLRVALLTFIMGVFFSIGTLFIMLHNGIMVGAFQYFFYQQGVFWESFTTIWVHGTLEISAIIIAGGAGITLGKGLVFPGTLTRMQAFQLSGRRALKILLGIAPIIVLAGIIEGFLTRYTESPSWVRLMIIGSSLTFILGYFRFYAWHKGKQTDLAKQFKDTKLPSTPKVVIDYNELKTSGGLFNDAFMLFRKHFSEILRYVAIGALLATGVLIAYQLLTDSIYDFNPPRSQVENLLYIFGFGYVKETIQNLGAFFSYSSILDPKFWINTILIALGSHVLSRLFLAEQHKQEQINLKAGLKHLPTMLVASLCWNLTLFLPGVFYFPFFLILSPFYFLWFIVAVHEDLNLAQAFPRLWRLGVSDIPKLAAINTAMILMTVVFLLITVSPVWIFLIQTLRSNFIVGSDILDLGTHIMLTFVYYLGILMGLALVSLGIHMAFFTLRETREASSLMQAIPHIGKRSKMMNIEQE